MAKKGSRKSSDDFFDDADELPDENFYDSGEGDSKLSDPDNEENLPGLFEPFAAPDIVIQAFTPVTFEDKDEQTTRSDLDVLNNFLALYHAGLPRIRTFDDLKKSSDGVVKLVEARRKVKQLAYGAVVQGGGGRVFEVIE